MRVLIIGAGTGGLCLAQGLKKAGIDVAVFERGNSDQQGLAGYGIHLNPDGWSALRECLPAENWQRLQAVVGDAGALLHFYDEQLHLLAVRDENKLQGKSSSEVQRRSVGRIELRNILLQGLDSASDRQGGLVHWNKEFTRYSRSPDGRITAEFADGSHAIGDVLVGADASHSRVREQLLPNVKRVDLEILTFAGRYPLTTESAAKLPAEFINGTLNNIVPKSADWMFASAWLNPQHKAVEAGTGGELNYVVWAYVASRKSYPDNVDSLDGAGRRDLVASRIAGWSPHLQTLVRECDPSTVMPVPLRSMPRLEPWTPSDVTVIGDAIHNMTPMAGVGANTALRDALVLRRELVDASTGRVSIPDAVGRYESQMREYANEAVHLSRSNAEKGASGAGLPRIVFRTLLRLAETFPVLKRRLFQA